MKRFSKKSLRLTTLLLASALSVSTLLTACSSSSQANKATGDQVKIDYWMWDSAQLPPYRACAAAFEKEHPNIKINVLQYGWDDYWTQLTATMVAEAAPDVFVNHTSQFAKFANLGQLLDIAPLVKQDGVKLEDYQEGLADLWLAPSGKARYGLPKDWDTEALFYNEEMAKAAGYTAEELDNLTWNPHDGGTFEKFIAKMTVDANGKHGDEPGFDKNKVKVYGLGYNESGGGYGQVQWSMYALANGWEYSDRNPWPTKWNYDDPKLAETIAWWRSLIEKGYMPSLSAATSGVGTLASLSSGSYATLFEGSWNIANVVKLGGGPFKVAPTPIGPSGRASVLNGLGDSIWSKTKHPKEAWEWVKFLGSSKCQKMVAEAAIVFPARSDSLAIAEKSFSELGIDPTAFTRHLKEGTGKTSPVTDVWAQLQTIMNPAMDTILKSSDDPAALLQDANRQVNEMTKLRSNKK